MNSHDVVVVGLLPRRCFFSFLLLLANSSDSPEYYYTHILFYSRQFYCLAGLFGDRATYCRRRLLAKFASNNNQQQRQRVFKVKAIYASFMSSSFRNGWRRHTISLHNQFLLLPLFDYFSPVQPAFVGMEFTWNSAHLKLFEINYFLLSLLLFIYHYVLLITIIIIVKYGGCCTVHTYVGRCECEQRATHSSSRCQ